jgi:hypothetical protein
MSATRSLPATGVLRARTAVARPLGATPNSLTYRHRSFSDALHGGYV